MASGGASPATIPSLGQKVPGLSPLNPASASSSTPSEDAPTRICVFCGASPGKSPAHLEAARSLAKVMHENNIHLVYGGGTVGIMGELARTLVSLSGPDSVHGIIPTPLIKYERSGWDPTSAAKEENGLIVPQYEQYGRTTVVDDMHSRKHMMAQQVLTGGKGSGFIALSGGYGTLEELMEVVTWNQLGIHTRGIVVLNIDGYWDGLLEWVKGAVGAGFVNEGSKGIIVEAKTAEDAVKALEEYKLSEGRFKLEWGKE
ncbi:hypothetical protein F5884DRAFT_767759 [Xylogone sp. PMI_703]|nr:hypothetical protein F5884DRAFT_767759 [Xylogone sp. PMI_703]